MARRSARAVRSDRDTGRFRQAEGATERLEHRAAVMRVFTSRPGEALDPDQLAEATGLTGRTAKAVMATLQADGWLVRAGTNRAGHPAWRRTTDDVGGNGHAPAGRQRSSAPRAQPGDAFYCRRCHRSETTEGLPPAGWLRLQERSQAADRPWYTQGLYCATACLLADVQAGR